MSKIHILSDELISQIAAGEIIERPASIIKELVENAIDANSTKINVFIQDSGRSKIIVEDNGNGMNAEDLSLAIKRHATSKLNDDNLMGITTYGFRGEALPSIASVSQMKIESNGLEISVHFSKENNIIKSNFENGTKITVSNLFDKLPARLKFLKSDNVELSHCISVIENFALTHPKIEFHARDDKKILCNFIEKSIEDRIKSIIGQDLFSRSIHILEENDVIKLEGYLFHPMDSKYSQSSQKIFINNRAVKDKIVSSSIRNAYKDIIPVGRFALCVIFITINPFYLDVNVSPTKSEIRFRDSNYIQKFISDTIKKNIDKFDRVSLTVDNSKLGFKDDSTYINNSNNIDYTKIKPNNNKMQLHDIKYNNNHSNDILHNQHHFSNFNINKEIGNIYSSNQDIKYNNNQDKQQNITGFNIDKEISNIQSGNCNNDKNKQGIITDFDIGKEICNIQSNNQEINNKNELCIEIDSIDSNKNQIIDNIDDNFFGEPIGQFLDTYIICKTQNELVIIDQHAVHEKIKMENIKSNLDKNNKQYLINPIKLSLNNKQLYIAMNIISKLNEFGFILNINEKTLVIEAIPNILSDINIEPFFYDILEDDLNINEIAVDDCIRMKIATSACHNSIRGGRKLSMQEMKATIQEMYKTFSIHQCNHNRPSFIKITLQQLNKIFERS